MLTTQLKVKKLYYKSIFQPFACITLTGFPQGQGSQGESGKKFLFRKSQGKSWKMSSLENGQGK